MKWKNNKDFKQKSCIYSDYFRKDSVAALWRIDFRGTRVETGEYLRLMSLPKWRGSTSI